MNKMENGIELITQERAEQVAKHGRTIDHDVKFNYSGQLGFAASLLAFEEIEYTDSRHEAPNGWDLEIWQKMHDKPYKDRLIIAGALIAAELDRLNQINTINE